MGSSDAEYESLKGELSSNESQQATTRSEISDLDNKIQRLRDAYNKLDEAKESVKVQKNIVGNMPDFYESLWKGAHANSVYTACESGGVLSTEYANYVDALDEVEDNINNEINRLNNIRSEKWGILQGLINAWNNLSTRIRNYFN